MTNIIVGQVVIYNDPERPFQGDALGPGKVIDLNTGEPTLATVAFLFAWPPAVVEIEYLKTLTMTLRQRTSIMDLLNPIYTSSF
jgi:hypothetical protein